MNNLFALLLIAGAAAIPAGAPAPQSAPGADRKTVDLTVYNQNLSLIREERTLELSRGTGRIVIPDIPATIDGSSLHFRSLTDPKSVRVLEQNYQYDLVHQARLLERYIGREVEFVRLNEETKQEYTVKGRLLASGYSQMIPYPGSAPQFQATGGMIAEVNGKVEVNPAGRLVLPSLPGGLILRPQLEWLVSSTREGRHESEISYMASGLSWMCNYVALLDKSDSRLDLTGWVTLTNTTGTTFPDAGLKLVAGDVNIVRDQFQGALRGKAMAVEMDQAAPQFTQTELFEYKLYALQRRTTLANNETKQIELTSAREAAAKKVFLYDGMGGQWRSFHNSYAYRNQGSFGQQSNTKVGVFVTFRNDEKSGLGMPLPKGKVRVYKKDEDGKEQFVGEDEIDHTPKDEEIRLYLGNAFDIVGERAQKDFRSLAGGRVVEETIEVKLRNHKREAVDVLVYEHPWRWSEWEILKTSTPWEKVDQSTLKFPVRIPKDGEAVVTYTIRYSW